MKTAGALSGLPRELRRGGGRLSTNIERQGATMKLFCIIAAAMTLVVASSTAMAAPKKQSLSDKATHRMKSPRSVPAPLRQWPPEADKASSGRVPIPQCPGTARCRASVPAAHPDLYFDAGLTFIGTGRTCGLGM